MKKSASLIWRVINFLAPRPRGVIDSSLFADNFPSQTFRLDSTRRTGDFSKIIIAIVSSKPSVIS